MASIVENTFDLTDRVILVTGAAGLIGSHFCELLARAHARVVAVDLDRHRIDQLTQKMQENDLPIVGFQMDITDPNSIQAGVQKIEHELGGLDVLIHCAAMDPKFDREHKDTHSATFEDFPLDAWKNAMDVNLTGAFLCVQQAAKLMLKQGHGNIILFSSIYGMVAPDQRVYESGSFKPPYYSVSKAGILGLTRYIASYYAGKN
ncbi:MAG TPA: short-chain dehydrogenase, partial [Anaerolineaceae bacterium]